MVHLLWNISGRVLKPVTSEASLQAIKSQYSYLRSQNYNRYLVFVTACAYGLVDFTKESIGNLWNARSCFKGEMVS